MSQQQVCNTCLINMPLTEFYVRRGKPLPRCKACERARLRQWRIDNPQKAKEIDRARNNDPKRVAKQKEYKRSEAGRASHARTQVRYVDEHPERRRARSSLEASIRRGEVTPWPVCAVPECATAKPEAHHPDYSRPLSVVWLCHRHHKQAHRLVSGYPAASIPDPFNTH